MKDKQKMKVIVVVAIAIAVVFGVLLIAFEQVKHVTSPGLCLVVKSKKKKRKFGIPTIFFYLKN